MPYQKIGYSLDKSRIKVGKSASLFVFSMKKERIFIPEDVIASITSAALRSTTRKRFSLSFNKYLFTEWRDSEEGKIVRQLVEEIRSKKYYVPELELIMINEKDEVIGYAMFSRFHIENKYLFLQLHFLWILCL